MTSKNENLILLTVSFPFGTGETFLETEIDYLSKKFNRIFILTSAENTENKRSLPQNVETIILSKKPHSFYRRLEILEYVFTPTFLSELFFIKKVLQEKITINKVKTLLYSLLNASHINQQIMDVVNQNNLTFEKTVFYSYWMNEQALALATNKQIQKKVCRVHGWDLYFERGTENYLPFRKLLLNKVLVFSISEKGLSYLKQKTGIDTAQLSKLGTGHQKRNIIKGDLKRIVSCSNVIPLKRVDLIIESLSLLENQNYEWIHFGNGPLLNKVIELAKEKGINAKFPGYLANKDVLDFFENNPIDIFINLSTTEGIPVSIMEAFSCGIPVIATNVGGTSEIVNNKNGILLPSTPTAEEVARNIVPFFNNEKSAITKRDEAYQTWNLKYNNVTFVSNEKLECQQ